MTIASTTSKVSYNGSGSVGPFPVTFKFIKNADIVATKRSSLGVETVLSLTTHYTLAGAGEASGGALTLVTALAVGESLVIARVPGIVQEVDYVENSAFPAETHEGALDLLTTICQSLQEQVDRSVKVEISSTTIPDDLLAEIAVDVASAAASAATATTQAGLADDARVAAEAAAASIPTFGAFGLTLAATTTASNARAELGLGTAALLDAGTDPGDVVQLDGGGALPAVSGANLTNLPGGGSQIKSISASVASNALTLGLAATALDFRSATLTDGAPTATSVGALSLIVPSGATLGTINGVAARLALLVAYNAGAPVLCVVNLAGGLRLDETALISPTTISDAADAANVIYSASSVAANSPYRVVGFVDITEATAGTWATGPTLVQGQGGAANVGYQRSWQDVTRVLGVTYYNPNGFEIEGNYITSATNSHTASITINGKVITGSSYTNTGANTAVSATIPSGASYVINDTGVTPSVATARELR